MARIFPVDPIEVQPSVKVAFARHIQQYQGRITNMKATLGHSLLSFDIYMQWYPLYEEVERILGQRMAYLYAWSISKASDCQICSTFFRKIIVDAGEKPETIELTISQKKLLDFGCSIAKYQGNIANHVYDAVADQYTAREMVTLIAFAGQMMAANIFNNVIETDMDEYLLDYLPAVNYH